MPTTVIGPTAADYPARVTVALVDIKRNWADKWQCQPELRLARATRATAGHDLDSCEFHRDYGAIKLPWENAIGQKSAWGSLAGWWVRLRMAGDGGQGQTFWTGRISGEARDLHGSTSHGPSGRQVFVAYGPGQILRKISVSRSYWIDADNVSVLELGWTPGMNHAQDGRGFWCGNRSSVTSNDVYLFGGKETWNHHQFVRYLLNRFVAEDDVGGPAWSLSGDYALLDGLHETIAFGETQTVDDLLRLLIPIRLGMDFVIDSDDDGFSIRVFALNAKEYSFGGQTLPKNTNLVRVKTSQSLANLRTHVTQTADHGYRAINVIGKRIVCCCSLRESGVPGPANQARSLVKLWTADNQADYDKGWQSFEDGAKNDEARRAERFRDVYQHFGAPADWDHHAGAAAPKTEADGTFSAVAGDYQNAVRRCLDWLPLREGVDYSKDPPDETNASPYGDLRPPMAILAEFAPMDLFDVDAGDVTNYTPVEMLGIHLSVSHTDLAIWLRSQPNHLLALGMDTTYATLHNPKYDYHGLVATVAFETDQRLRLSFALPDAKPSDGVLDVMVRDAECWYLAPQTVLGVTPFAPGVVPKLITSGDDGWIIRDDSDRLRFVMAGVLSRYYASRCRAEITIEGLVPWGALLGQILTMIDDGGNVQDMAAPITHVEWHVPHKGVPQTIVRAGFAS